MILLLWAACGLFTTRSGLAAFDTLTFVSDGVRLDSSTGTCPTLDDRVTATLNGTPLTLVQPGGKGLGSSQDGLTPAMVCRPPLFVAGARPTGKVRIELADGVDTWVVELDEVGATAQIIVPPTLQMGTSPSLATTPPGSRFVPAGLTSRGLLELHSDGGCYVAVYDPPFAKTMASQPAPGRLDLTLPAGTCTGPGYLWFFGQVDQPVLQCPVGVQCKSWEQANLRIPFTWQ